MASYKDFLEAINGSSQEEEEKRRAKLRDRAKEIKSARDTQVKAKEAEDNKGFLDKALDFAGNVVKGTVDAATSIPRKVIKTVGAALDPSDIEGSVGELNKRYNAGEINQEELQKQFQDLTGDIIGNKLTVTKAGIVQDAPDELKELGDFTKQFVGAGVDTAGVLPVAGGVKAGVEIGKQGIKQVAKEAVKSNAKQALVYGTADTANDVIQGKEINPLELAANYLMPAATGVTGEAIGYGAKRGVDAAKMSMDEFRLQPRSVREGGFIRVPGGRDEPLAGADELAQQTFPGPTGRDTDVPTKPGESPIDQGSSLIDNPVEPGVTFKSREEIMKENKVKRPFIDKLNEQMFDANAPLRDLGKAYEKKTGTKLLPEDDPAALAQLRNGMDEAGAARLQGVVQDFDYVRKEKLSEDVKQFGVAQQVVGDRADVYGSETVAVEKAKIEEMASRLGPEKFGQVQAATQRIIDFQDDQLQRLRDNGFVSKEGYDAIKEFNPHYFTRFNLAEYIDANQKTFASTNSNNISKNLVQAVKGVGNDRQFIIEDPFEAITRSAMKTENIIQNNKIFHSTQKLSETLPDLVIKGRNAEDVTARMSLAGENKELRPIRDQMDKAIKRDSRTVGKLQTIINNLEKKGLNTALKGGGQRMTPGDMTVSGLGGDVATSQTGKISRTADDEMTDLSRQVETAITRRDNGSTKAQGVVDEGIIEGAGINATTTGSKLGAQDTRSFVHNLIENGSRADIDRIKKQIGTKDAKVTALLDEIGVAKSEYDEIAGKIKDNSNEAAAHADTDTPAGYEAVSGFTDGIKETVYIPQYMADAYKGKNDIQRSALDDIVMAASKPFKAAATVLSPAFLVKNSIRDTGTHWLTSKNIPVKDRLLIVPYAKRWTQGFMDSLTNSKFAQDVTKAGGGAAGVFNDKGNTDQIVRDVTKKLSGVEVKTADGMFKTALKMVGKYTGASKIAGGYVKGMQNAGRALEYAPRLAEARAAIEKGASDPAAALAARNALGDLQNAGTVSRILNNYTPFFNSILQGNKRIYDAVKEDPGKMAAMLATGVALPAVSGYVWNRTMYPDVLNNLSEQDRENNFVVILGDNKDENGRYTDVLKIPKNDAAKVFGNNIEVALDKMAGQDSQSFAELFMKTIGYASPLQIERDGKLSADAILGSAPVTSNPLFRVPIENTTNHSFFTGREVVPDSKEGLSAEQQIDKNTSPIDAALAKVTGISPHQIKNTREGVSAGLLNGKTPVDQVKNVVAGSNGSRAQGEFYKIYNDARQSKASINKLINDSIAAGDTATARQAAQEYNAYLSTKFSPYVERYGDNIDDSLAEQLVGLKINLTSRGVKQRRKSLREKAVN
jgi:conjugative element/phage-associated large polyvalent protein